MFVDALQACTLCTYIHMHNAQALAYALAHGAASIGECPLKLTWMSMKAMHTSNRITFEANRIHLLE